MYYVPPPPITHVIPQKKQHHQPIKIKCVCAPPLKNTR